MSKCNDKSSVPQGDSPRVYQMLFHAIDGLPTAGFWDNDDGDDINVFNLGQAVKRFGMTRRELVDLWERTVSPSTKSRLGDPLPSKGEIDTINIVLTCAGTTFDRSVWLADGVDLATFVNACQDDDDFLDPMTSRGSLVGDVAGRLVFLGRWQGSPTETIRATVMAVQVTYKGRGCYENFIDPTI